MIRLDVCDLDSNNLREIGHIEGAYLYASDFKWLPNEKAVSFTQDGKLYVLPVE